jgi:hypothetical protein
MLLSAGTYCLLDGFPLSFIYLKPDGIDNKLISSLLDNSRL